MMSLDSVPSPHVTGKHEGSQGTHPNWWRLTTSLSQMPRVDTCLPGLSSPGFLPCLSFLEVFDDTVWEEMVFDQ